MLATDPPELTLLADRAPVPTPATLDWAVESVHTVGANSPQKDKFGKYVGISIVERWRRVEPCIQGGELERSGQLDGEVHPRGGWSAS